MVQSDWSQLCNLAKQVGVKLHWEKSGDNDITEASHAQVIIGSENVKIVTGKLIQKDILEKQLSDDLEDLKSLPMQGTFVDIKNADYLLSQNIFQNFKISANLISFWRKSRHNVLSCHFTLSLWYPEHSPERPLDRYKLESISHVLNGCKEIKNNYSKRHDAILDKVVSELKHHCNEMFVNKTVRCSFREFAEESEHRRELNLKPDIAIKGKQGLA